MALIKENDLTEGMSGKFGKKIVFRVVKGVTVASRRSTIERIATPNQIAHRERFQLATQYAKAKMQDPIAKEEYTLMAGDSPFSSAYTAAMKDYMVAPKIVDVDTSAYEGAANSIIAVKVSDKFKTIQVNVTIHNPDGSVLESGNALLAQGDIAWKYTTSGTLSVLAGSKVVVKAIDRPGNQTVFEKQL